MANEKTDNIGSGGGNPTKAEPNQTQAAGEARRSGKESREKGNGGAGFQEETGEKGVFPGEGKISFRPAAGRGSQAPWERCGGKGHPQGRQGQAGADVFSGRPQRNRQEHDFVRVRRRYVYRGLRPCLPGRGYAGCGPGNPGFHLCRTQQEQNPRHPAHPRS